MLEELKKANTHVDYVLLTIGGNDLGFSDIVSKVFKSDMEKDAASSNRKTRENGLKAMLERAEGKLTDDGWGEIYMSLYSLYREILENYADEETALIVAGYPRLFSENIKGELIYSESMANSLLGLVTITKAEAEAVNSAVMLFNGIIQDMVDDLYEDGYNIYFVDVADSEQFKGHEAYSANPALNPVVLLKQSEDLTNDSLDLFVSAYSMHPNDAGAQAYADCVQKKIDELEALKRYKYALARLTKGGSWYEGVTDTVYYGYADHARFEQNDYYDVKITNYDPENPTAFTASGEGYAYDGTDDSDFMYDLDYDGSNTLYSYYFYDEWSGQYVYAAENDARVSGFPDLYDMEGVTEECFQEITDLKEYSFTAHLSEEQYTALGLDVAGTLDWWSKNERSSDDGDYTSIADALQSDDPNEILGAFADFYGSGQVWDYILYGEMGVADTASFAPVKTDSVTMEIKFHDDMTFDSIVFKTVGTVEGFSGANSLGEMKITRERCFHLSDQPTDDYYSLLSDDSSEEYDMYSDYEDFLNAFQDALIEGFGLGW